MSRSQFQHQINDQYIKMDFQINLSFQINFINFTNMKILFLLTILVGVYSKGSQPMLTLITYVYDLNRFHQSSLVSEPLQFGITDYETLLRSKQNIIIFGQKHLEYFIMERRSQHNTVFIPKEFQQLSTLWHFQYSSKDIDKLSLQTQSNPQKVKKMIDTVKIFLMAQAAKYDKFSSDILVWSDPYKFIKTEDYIHQEQVMKEFYILLQPQWMFLTKQQQKFKYVKFQASRREIMLANSHFMSQEQVITTFMGGNIDVIQDIKNAYQNLLRIVLEDKINSQKSSLSMLPKRYPSLVPTTANVYVFDILNKLHIYNKINHASKHSRYFKGLFLSDGSIIVEDTFTAKYEIKITSQQRNNAYQQDPHEKIMYVKERTDQRIKLNQNIKKTLHVSYYLWKAAFICQIMFFIMLSIFYVKLIQLNSQRHKNGVGLQQVKGKCKPYVDLSDGSQSTRLK